MCPEFETGNTSPKSQTFVEHVPVFRGSKKRKKLRAIVNMFGRRRDKYLMSQITTSVPPYLLHPSKSMKPSLRITMSGCLEKD